LAIIYLKDLIVEATHGLHQHEKEQVQRFKINVEVSFDASNAVRSDDIKDTVNWSDLRQKVINVAQDNSFNLVERLAQQVANDILLDKRVEAVTVSIDKLDAFGNGIPGVKIEEKQG
jgi:dihydroneopterin aldolase